MWWTWIITGVLGAPLTLVLHEFMHVLTAWHYGSKVVAFKPWPHIEPGLGGFVWGSIKHRPGLVAAQQRISYRMPLIKAGVLLVVWGLLGWGWHPLWLLAAWELTDVINWLQSYLRMSGGDGGTYRHLTAVR